MKHSTNYSNAFIAVAEDSNALTGEIPPLRGGEKTVAGHQFDRLYSKPYQYTSDEVLFDIHCQRKEVPETERESEFKNFFSKGQPCFRASPLGKRYGWGIHFDESSKMAIYAIDSKEYQLLLSDTSLKQTRAMKSKR